MHDRTTQQNESDSKAQVFRIEAGRVYMGVTVATQKYCCLLRYAGMTEFPYWTGA
jgi:hypothetical protein